MRRVLKIGAMADSVKQQLNSSVELLVHVMSTVECSRLHDDYMTGLHSLCHRALLVLKTTSVEVSFILFALMSSCLGGAGFGVGLVIERSLVRLPAGGLSSQLR